MSDEARFKPESRGGFVWLAGAVAIVAAWVFVRDLWTVLVAQGFFALMAWTAVMRTKRVVGGKVAALVATLQALLGGIVWLVGKAVNELAGRVAMADDRSIAFGMAISLLIACGAACWLIAAALPAEARASGHPAARLFAEACRTVGRSRSLWGYAAVAAAIVLVSATVGLGENLALQIAVGLAAAYAQVAMPAAVANEGRGRGSRGAVSSAAGRRKGRKVFLIAFLIGHFMLYLFYVGLFAASEAWNAWSGLETALLYPAAWLAGAVYALLAWLAGKIRFLYYGVLSVIVLANALLFGLILSLFGGTILS